MRTAAAALMILVLALCVSFSTLDPAPAHADVHGIAFGFVQSVEPDFDGLGTCRMILLYDRYNVIDFPSGELANACEKATSQEEFHYFEAIVDDAGLIPCTPVSCSIVSAMSHYTAAEVVIP